MVGSIFFVMLGVIIAGYLAFFAWLLNIARLTYSKIPAFWKASLLALWFMIIAGHFLILFAPHSMSFPSLALGGFVIGLAVAAYSLPLSKANSAVRSPRTGQILGLVPSILVVAFFTVFLTSGYIRMGSRFFAVNDRVIIVLGIVFAVGIFGLVAAWLKIKLFFVFAGFVLFEISVLGFMTIGILVLPVAMLFQAAGISLATVSQRRDRLSVA